MTPLEPRRPAPKVVVPVSTPLTGTAPIEPPPQRWRTHVILFMLTIVTTTIAGAGNAGVDPITQWWNIYLGIPFSLTLLTILLVHEFGHYTLARLHNVPTSLPYFIPGPPFLIGTFGAVIRMRMLPPNRRALFDVGAAGPWAGLLLSIPAIVVGLQWSEVRPLALQEAGIVLGQPLLFEWLSHLALGVTPDHVNIILHPVALAGWVGLLVTFLNLLPMGQLDGGHIAYAMFGAGHRWVARGFLAVIFVLGFLGWQGWFVWVVLLLVMGVEHPPTFDAHIPLDWRRQLAGWLTVGVFAVTFMAEPIGWTTPPPVVPGERIPVAWDGGQGPATAPIRRGGIVVLFPAPVAPVAAKGIAL